MSVVSPVISVIVPVYNSEKYLHKCIDSILSQSFTNFELLLVDDGSQDCSGEICDEYTVKDSRVRAFHKANSGVSSARNLGIENANGEWVVFVDSDDWCEPKYLEDFFSSNFDVQTDDLVIQGRKENDAIVPLKSGIYTDISKGLSSNNLLTFGAPYCKLYSRDLINKNNIRFPLDYSYGEDTVFFFHVLYHIKRLIIIEKYNYHYIKASDSSLSRKDHDFDHLEKFMIDSMNYIKAIDDKYKANNSLVDAYKPHFLNTLMRSMANMYRLGYCRQRQEDCIKRVKIDLLPYLGNSHNIAVSVIHLLPISMLRFIFEIIMKIRIN
jgi:glycosyltransferase involved in cell wall biosynthesis